jgi:hypothetical protein
MGFGKVCQALRKPGNARDLLEALSQEDHPAQINPSAIQPCFVGSVHCIPSRSDRLLDVDWPGDPSVTDGNSDRISSRIKPSRSYDLL